MGSGPRIQAQGSIHGDQVNVRTARTLALVVARGGSRSIPQKNIALVAGKPLIAWTIEAALACPEVARVVVSTDDADIESAAKKCGADVPFTRPRDLAQDDTPTIPVVVHALRWLEANEGYRPERLILLQPTSPLRTTGDIGGAIALADEKAAVSVVSVTPAASHPYLMKRITPEGLLEDLVRHDPVLRRQDLDAVYALNGAIYLTERNHLLRSRELLRGRDPRLRDATGTIDRRGHPVGPRAV